MSPSPFDPIAVGALTIRFRVEGADLCVFDVDVPAGARVPAPHSHDAFEETVFGVAGVTTWTVDGDTFELSAGGALRVPRGAVHHFANHGDEDARFTATLTPGALGSGYFREIGGAVAGCPAAVEAVMRRHGLTPAPAAVASPR